MKRFHDYHNDPNAQNEEHHSQYSICCMHDWQMSTSSTMFMFKKSQRHNPGGIYAFFYNYLFGSGIIIPYSLFTLFYFSNILLTFSSAKIFKNTIQSIAIILIYQLNKLLFHQVQIQFTYIINPTLTH